jgi:hypothetical protein
VFQAWFDDSGKEGIAQSPVYLLAGYSTRIRVWENLSDEWQAELDRAPRLRWLHATEAYNLKGEFGFDKKTNLPSEWVKSHGRGNTKARDERLLRFASILIKHLKGEVGHGMFWMLKHDDYAHFHNIISTHPTITNEEKRMLKNPYFLSFQKIIGNMLKMQVLKTVTSGTREKIQILFDEGIDDRENLEVAFEKFVEMLQFEPPIHRDLLANKTAEFRNDKDNPPLQAADLFAWHVRRFCFKSAKREPYDDPVWTALRHPELVVLHQKYDENDWIRILEGIRDNNLVMRDGKVLRLRRP